MAAKDAVIITPYRDGPLLVRGPVQLSLPGGSPTDNRRRAVALCRCGKSKLRPFCDGTHKLIGFRAPGATPGA
jgi:CDGSH-type Zn-finger protein